MAPPIVFVTPQVQLLQAAEDGDLRLFERTAIALDGGQGRLREAVESAIEIDRGCGVLHIAAGHGRLPVCAYLVEDFQFNVDAVDDSGETPLHYAVVNGSENTVWFLLDHGANPNKPAGGRSCSPLHYAVVERKCEIVNVLVLKGADVDLCCHWGTPLFIAAACGFDDVIETLLDHYADCNKAVSIANTPLIIALRAHKQKCVKLMIEAGADLKGVGSADPVIVAITEGSTECLKCLIEAGARGGPTSIQGYSAEYPNILFGRLPIEVSASLNSRADVEILFPLTSRIPSVREWSIDGIIAYVKSTKEALGYYKKDTTLISNRSLCWLKMGEGDKALRDAQICRRRRCDWPKACFREGAAHMLLKDYEKARDAFADGLKLDPGNTEIQNALREALTFLEDVT